MAPFIKNVIFKNIWKFQIEFAARLKLPLPHLATRACCDCCMQSVLKITPRSEQKQRRPRITCKGSSHTHKSRSKCGLQNRLRDVKKERDGGRGDEGKGQLDLLRCRRRRFRHVKSVSDMKGPALPCLALPRHKAQKPLITLRFLFSSALECVYVSVCVCQPRPY